MKLDAIFYVPRDKKILDRKNPFIRWSRFLLTALLLLPVACAGQAPAVVPTPQVFDSPAKQINSFTTLTLLSKDDPSHAHWVDYFSGSIDIDGDVLASGAPEWGRPPGEGAGAAYIFRRSAQGEWQRKATLTASDRDDGFQFDQHFGEAIAVQGGLIAVGAPGYDDPQAGDNTGAVYLYEYDGGAWVETSKLSSSQKKPGARMGSGLTIDGDVMAVSGAPEAGSIALFQRGAGGWREIAQVTVPASPDGKPPHVLMDLYGDTLAVSTVTTDPPQDETNELAVIQSLRRAGTVTLFERSGDEWKQTYQTPPQEASLYRMYQEAPFGLPISLGGEAGKASLLAVGKPGFPRSGRETGSVAIYTREKRGWAPQAELKLEQGEPVPGALSRFFGPDPGAGFFGAFVEVEGNRLAVVSTFANSVYVFERQGLDWVYRFRITPGPDIGDDFQRRTVAMSGDTLLLGSPGELGGGSVFVFELAN